MALRPQAPKFIFIALIAGTFAAAVCLMLGITGPITNAITIGISAGVMYATREKWLA